MNLQLEGFEVHTAEDGQECLVKAEELSPDVITLDVMMPRLDGWITARQLRDSSATHRVKVVLITARAQEADFRRGQELGVDAFLPKPFEPAELMRVVRELASPAQPLPGEP